MSNARTEEFLDLYRRLESGAQRLLGGDGRSSAVMRLAHQRGFTGWRDELDFCREVRNLLSHEPKVNGAYAFYPSDQLLGLLRQLVQLVENPVTVAGRMTPVGRMLVCTPGAQALPVMRQMRRDGLSHVPVLSGGRVQSVFSVDTVFQAVLDGAVQPDEQTRIGDFELYLSLERHMNQSFVFVPESMSLGDAGALFDRAYDKNNKIKLLLVTKTGLPGERLLGVVSPYDLLEHGA